MRDKEDKKTMQIPNVLQFIEESLADNEPRQEALRKILDDIFDYEHELDEEACCHTASEIREGKCPCTPLDEIPALQHMAELWT